VKDGMAQKRVIRTTGRPSEQDDEEDEETWGEWAKRSYARAWYILLCIFIDLFILLEVANGDTFISWGLGLIALFIVIAVEVFIYTKLWGANGRWVRDD
jgi:hypothetical protein